MVEEKADEFRVYSITEWPAALSAVVVLFFPRSIVAFLALCSFQITNYAAQLPLSVNHAVAITLINVAFLYCFGRAALRAGSLAKIDASAVMEQVAPIIRWGAVAVYLFAAFHKLNWGYFDVENSCFVDSYRHLSRTLPLLPELNHAVRWIGIFGSVAAEFGIPILLIFGRTRLLGLVIGLVFHMMLGLRHPSFSTLVFALYFVFLPRPFLSACRDRIVRMGWGHVSWRGIAALATLPAFVLWTATPWYLHDEQVVKQFRHLSWFVLFTLVLIASAFVLMPVLRRGGTRLLALPLRWRVAPVGLLLLAIMCVNGFAPYLGIKTTSAFAMYSNLRTEGGESNHWIISKNALQIVHFQDDLVEIQSSNYQPLQNLLTERWRTTFVQLQMTLWDAKQRGVRNVSLTFTRNGETYSSDSAEQDPGLARQLPWYVRKFVHYRFVPPRGENRPQW